MTDDVREEWFQSQQDGRVYPVGRALRETFDADNHATLGSDVTGLMIDLSRVPYQPGGARPDGAGEQMAISDRRPSMLARVGGLFGRR